MNYLKKYESFIKDLNPMDEGFMSLSNIANNSKKPDIKENIKKIIEVIKSAGLKDNNSILGLISVIGKESGFSLVRETTKNLPDDEKWLRKTFPAFNDYEGSVVEVKKNREKTFYNIAYGPDSKAGKALGNTGENDGYDYRGGGYTQLTGRKWYNYMGITNPKDIETPEGAAKALKKSIESYIGPNPEKIKFDTPQKAASYFVDKVRGNSSTHQKEYEKSIKILDTFFKDSGKYKIPK